MKKHVLFLLILVILFMAACSKTDTTEVSATPITTPEPTIITTAIPDPTPIPTPSFDEVSKLSGIPFSEFTEDMNKDYTPIAVMIENSPAARPQFGLQQANIVYEAPVEGSITRFMAIYNDILPEKVEPVRSARIYYIKMQQPYDCIYVHYGGPEDPGYASYIYDEDSEHIRIRVNGISGHWDDYFVRDPKRSKPHNVICDMTQVVELYDYQPEPIPFKYSYDDGRTYEGNPIQEIDLPFFAGDNFVSYVYDEQSNLLLRHMAGKPFLAAETNEAVTVQNLIIQYVNLPKVKELSGRRIIDVLGTGDADYVIDGIHITGTWKRDNYEDPTKYYDENGEEIILTPGNTWIALHPNTSNINVIE